MGSSLPPETALPTFGQLYIRRALLLLEAFLFGDLGEAGPGVGVSDPATGG